MFVFPFLLKLVLLIVLVDFNVTKMLSFCLSIEINSWSSRFLAKTKNFLADLCYAVICSKHKHQISIKIYLELSTTAQYFVEFLLCC